MVDMKYRRKSSEVLKKAKEKGKIKKYNDFCDTEEAKRYALTEEETIYYMNKQKGVDNL